jgi:aminoglycoside phosphotransferase (APT) family kinase protein
MAVQTQTHDLTFTATEVRKRYVSWDDGEPDREWGCLTLLADHAPGVAPRPLRRETYDGAPVVVMERLPGEPLGRAPLTREQTTSLGRALRRLYDVPLASVQAAPLTERRYGPSTHAQTVAQWLGDSYDLAECRDPALVAEGVAAALGWLARPDILPEPRLVALGISDLNPANILWDGETCRLVDFEDGGLTDPAYELADHVEHLAGRLAGVFDPEALVDAVGLSEEERERMRAYRPLWAAFWLAMLLPGNGGFRRNPPGTTEAQAARILALLG